MKFKSCKRTLSDFIRTKLMELGSGYYIENGEVYFHNPERPIIFTYRTKDFIIIRHSKIIKFSISPTSTTNKRVFKWIENFIQSEDKIVTPGGRTLSAKGKIIRNKTEFIYFIFNADSNAVKIGKAKKVFQRMKSLQSATPAHLKLLKIIDCKAGKEASTLESSLHQQFRHLNLVGEWFKFDKLLHNFVEEL